MTDIAIEVWYHLNDIMYWFRDAANGWFKDWQQVLTSTGYQTGIANPALIHNSSNSARGAVHGDDFYVLATANGLDELNDLLAFKYSVRETHRLGFETVVSERPQSSTE